MDAPKVGTWRELLCERTVEREAWRPRVRKMKQPRVKITLGSHVVTGSDLAFTMST